MEWEIMLVVSLSEACSLIEEEGVKSALSSFTCFDKRYLSTQEVQDFIRINAFKTDAQSLSRTHLFLDNDYQIAGFFTLMIKTFQISVHQDQRQEFVSLSNSRRKSLGIRKVDDDTYILHSYLIAQLARNFSVKSDVSGEMILHQALQYIQDAYYRVGGICCATVEYCPTPKLHDFYSEAGFECISDNPTTKNILGALTLK
jgi:hypothetical protein